MWWLHGSLQAVGQAAAAAEADTSRPSSAHQARLRALWPNVRAAASRAVLQAASAMQARAAGCAGRAAAHAAATVPGYGAGEGAAEHATGSDSGAGGEDGCDEGYPYDDYDAEGGEAEGDSMGGMREASEGVGPSSSGMGLSSGDEPAGAKEGEGEEWEGEEWEGEEGEGAWHDAPSDDGRTRSDAIVIDDD